MSDLIVFWNHVGREHGGLTYTEDLRRNDPEVIQHALGLKEQQAREALGKVQYLRHDAHTLIEVAAAESAKKFIIVYCLDLGLQFSLNYKQKYPWWVVDVVDIEEVRPNVFCAHDLLIDVEIRQDGTYRVHDIDEFEEAISAGILTPRQIQVALRSFHWIIDRLNQHAFPDERIKEIMAVFSIWNAQHQ